ncbi:hypothetical protein [Mesorhizobium temperatum]|uniref:SnoaL-like domain-containing protein n=1 Tax=Mesorhizobium temperatum TaxID=241416 RepID=A0A271LEA6_9HYPH|nr:hypothetical protein [Mesorhizobium temperatum]PAQ05765.1 hypothetical protein CIT26_26355 [Mesorhizobium temperatum]
MPVKSRSDLIRSYFAAYRANDRSVIEAVLTGDFTSPYDDAIDRATYFARCWPNSTLFKSIPVERICEDATVLSFSIAAKRSKGLPQHRIAFVPGR